MSWIKEGPVHAIALFVTVAGMLLGAYFSLRATGEAQQVALAGFEARLVIVEKSLSARQDADERFAAEMRAALTVIVNGVSDLRVQEAKRGK
jgi:hypothetical protein